MPNKTGKQAGGGNTPTVGKFATVAGVCAVCGHKLPLGQAGDVGETCKRHQGKMRKFYKTAKSGDGLVTLASLCRLAERHGKTAYMVVSLTGKDGGTLPPADPTWQVYIWQGHKYLKAEALAALQKLLGITPA